ncbi:MAG TPA: hypothetical protein VGH40_01170 [Roseiarcus sp.]|jgi:hypothetical protein
MEAASETETLKAQLPRALPASVTPTSTSMSAASAAKLEAAGEIDHNPIFEALVTPDEDISGLVAYSIYKQNKRAWLDDFIKATGRGPTEAESRAYIIGESTERRLNTYRHLAASTLAGQGPRALGRGLVGKANSLTSALWALVIVIVAVAVLAVAMHGGVLGGGAK